jgi:hypothetical protein
MTVYLVWTPMYEEPIGIYSSRELAQKRIDKYPERERQHYNIMEFTVDKEKTE